MVQTDTASLARHVTFSWLQIFRNSFEILQNESMNRIAESVLQIK